jgi:hypothetical protein
LPPDHQNLPAQGPIDAGNLRHLGSIQQQQSNLMQRGNSPPEKELESPSGHVIARIRPLKGSQMQGGQRTAGSLGNPKEYR